MKTKASLFDDYSIRYEILDENDKTHIHYNDFKFLKTKMLKCIYQEYPNWKTVRAWWDERNAPFGFISNNERAQELADLEIQKKDWNYLPEYDTDLVVKIWFKNDDQFVEGGIKKSYLMKGFLDHLYETYGNEWECIETFFEDTGDEAYDYIENTKYRMENRYIGVSTLKQLRRSLNKAKYQQEKLERKHLFYLLWFENKPYFKIGDTTNLKFRMYSYLFPQTDADKYFYSNSTIDFNRSFIVQGLEDNSLELFLKKEFNDFLYFKNQGSFDSKEIFDKKCRPTTL